MFHHRAHRHHKSTFSELFYRHSHESIWHLLATELDINIVDTWLGEQIENIKESILLYDFSVDRAVEESLMVFSKFSSAILFSTYVPVCDVILHVTMPSPASRASTVKRFFLPKMTFSAALFTNLHLFASPEGADVRANGEPSISFPA